MDLIMDSNSKFLNFLESLKTDDNKALIEAVTKGFDVLTETPNEIKSLGLNYDDADTMPFFYSVVEDNLYIDKEENSFHDDFLNKIIRNDEEYNESDPNSFDKIRKWLGLNAASLPILGRLWANKRIISFWRYPSVEAFKKIIDLIKSNGVNIDSSWRVEVFNKDMESESILIPIEEYSGKFVESGISKQDELDKMREQHTLSPIEKQKQKQNNPTKELPVKKVDTGGLSMAEYNFKKNQA